MTGPSPAGTPGPGDAPALALDEAVRLGPPAPEAAGASELRPEEPRSPVTEDVLAIPLGTRSLVSRSLDLLTRPDAGLRSASFYIGFLFLATIGPAAMLLAATWFTYGVQLIELDPPTGDWSAWLAIAAVPAVLGYLAASVEATSMATAVIAGRAEGRPLRLPQSIAIARRRFWRVAAVQLLVGILVGVAQELAGLAGAALGPPGGFDVGLQLVAGLLVTAPFVYAPAGVILGEVTALDALTRSVTLVRARIRLAIVVTLFSVLSQFVVLFGLDLGLGMVIRVVEGAGLGGSLPPVIGVLVAAALVFALGTLTFTVQAIAAAPQVHAFAALTHYTRGLEVGRREPLEIRRPWDPYVTRPLAIGIVVGVVAMLLGLAALPG